MIIKNQEQQIIRKAALVNNELSMFRWGMREALARRSSSNVWGNGFIFDTEKENVEKAFQRFKKINKLYNLFPYIEKELSKYGRVVLTLNKSKTNDILVNVVPQLFFSGIGKVFCNEQLAVIYQRFDIDNKSILVKSTYDTQKVKNEFYSMSETQELLVMDSTKEVEEYLQIPKEYTHNLGFVPVVELVNINYYQTNFNQYQFLMLSDWYPANQYEELAYQAFIDLEKELMLNHSRIVGTEGTQQLIQQLRAQQAQNGRVVLEDFLIETTHGTDIKIMNGNGDFEKYTGVINSIYDIYYKQSGLSRFSEGGGAQKTVAETASIRSQMIETIKHKANLREFQILELISKALAMYGVIDYFEDNSINFKINTNIIKDDAIYLDNLIKQLEIGAITTIDIIKEFKHVGEKEAQEIYEKNKEFMEKNNDFFGELFVDKENGSNPDQEIDNTGKHKDRAKNGEQ